MVQGGMSCIKYLMFVFNFIFVVCGITLIAIGAIASQGNYTVFMGSKYMTAPVILIVVGVIIFVLAFLGCCGAVRENHCMVMTFGILLFLIFVIEIAAGITAYMYQSELETFLKKNMNETIHQGKKDAMDVWDDMQKNWKCCGVDGPKDWPTLPSTCCPDSPNNCTLPDAYTKGCYDQMLDNIKGEIKKIGGVAIGIAVVELIGVMFSWCLASAIKKEYEGV